MSDYKIKLEVFEGPLDLLMHLIEKHQLDIYDIPIAVITEQYLDYIRQMEEFNVEIASSFLVMAATLLQIKSRMLLPKPPKAAEIVEEEADPRQELVDKLLEYRKFKQAASLFEDLARQREQVFTRLPQQFPAAFSLPEGLSLDDLLRAFTAVWESAGDDYALVAREEISIQDKMYDIIHVLRQRGGRTEFSHTIIRSGMKNEVIAAFLALLELIRLNRVWIKQQAPLEPIYLMLRE